MDTTWLARSQMLLGAEKIKTLNNSRVAVFGLGGVGSYTVEALARTGVGSLVLIDADTVADTNRNRQLVADTTTLGQPKVEVAARRVKAIWPEIQLQTVQQFILPGCDLSFLEGCDYVVDAIDTVSAKLYLAEYCKQKGMPLICAMGTGNKTDPTALQVADIEKTKVCPLCRVMRRELRARGITGVKVVYSEEEPLTPTPSDEDPNRRSLPGSLIFVPAAAGLLLAREVVFDLTKEPAYVAK